MFEPNEEQEVLDVRKLSFTAAVLLAAVGSAEAQESREATFLSGMIFYRDVCPYGKVKMPDYVSRNIDERWAYIPHGTKKVAERSRDNEYL